MAKGRPIHGEGLENLQDYVAETATYASDTNELAEENRTLEQELADLQALHQERTLPSARPNVDALIQEAQLRVDRLNTRPSAETLESDSGSGADYTKMPPDAEARSRVAGDPGITGVGDNIR